MGLGVWKLRIRDKTAWGHGGWLGDFVSLTFYVPDLELSVAYSSSGADISRQEAPGRYLLRAYTNNLPENLSMCYEPSDA